MPAAAIYSRISDDKTGLEAGVTRQLAECRELAAKKNLAVAYEFTDNDLSATTGVRRPQFERVLELVQGGILDTIIVWHPDRFYRTIKDLGRILDVAKATGLSIVSVQAGLVDLSTPAGRLQAGILAAVAAHEGEHRTARQKTAYRARAENGEWKFVHRPFGYERVNGEVVQVPGEAEIVEDLLHQYWEGRRSRHATVKWLNDSGYTTPAGKRWTVPTVRDLLENPRYAGINYYLGQEIGRGAWEPIVDEVTWRRWQNAAATRKRANTFTGAKYLLTGIATCAVCGGPIYVKTLKQWRSYYCAERGCVQRSLPKVDDLVERVVIGWLATPEGRATVTPPAPDLEPLHLERSDLQDRLDSLASLVADGTLTPTAVREVAAPLRKNLNRLDEQIAEATELAPINVAPDDIVAAWANLTLDEKRSLLRRTLTVQIDTQGNTNRFDPSAIHIGFKS